MAEERKQVTFVVQLEAYGQHDEHHEMHLANTMARLLQQAFGMDKIKLYVNAKRLIYDPALKLGYQLNYEDEVVDVDDCFEDMDAAIDHIERVDLAGAYEDDDPVA